MLLLPFTAKISTEFNIPAVQKLKLFVGLGYSVIISDTGQGFVIDDTNEEGGLNFNAGLSFDLTNRLFVQMQYDYIRLRVKYTTIGPKQNVDSSFLKFGLGFRF